MLIGRKVPDVTFRTRVRDESVGGPNPFRWQDMTSDDYFKGKRVILFSLPGAFTPTCSTYQLPDFEKMYPEFQAEGIDEIYCMHGHDRLGAGRACGEHAFGIQVEGILVNVGKYGPCAHARDGAGRGKEGKRRGHNLVTRPDLQGHERHQKRIGSR